MYLKHLENKRGYTVVDPRNGAYFWASEDLLIELIKKGKVKPQGSKRYISALHWTGTPLSVVLSAEERQQLEGGSSARPTKYSHNREITSTADRRVIPFNENPRGVWHLVYQPEFTEPIHRAVLLSVLSKAA